METINIDDYKIPVPARFMIIGPSGSGKSFFTAQMIRQHETMFRKKADKIIYYYSIIQPFMTKLLEEVPIMELHQGFDPELYKDRDPSTHLVLIIDDLMQEENLYPELSSLFTRYSRHLNITVLYLCQNAYFKGNTAAVRYGRDVLSNASEMVLFRNPRDSLASLSIGRAAYPHAYRWFKAVLADATKKSYSYLYLSFHPETSEKLMVRSNIFFMTEVPIIYTQP